MVKGEETIEYTFDGTPLVLIENACKKRENGSPCKLYRCETEITNGNKINKHYCGGNSVWCDHIMGIALILSDSNSGLHKKVFDRK